MASSGVRRLEQSKLASRKGMKNVGGRKKGDSSKKEEASESIEKERSEKE